MHVLNAALKCTCVVFSIARWDPSGYLGRAHKWHCSLPTQAGRHQASYACPIEAGE